MARGILDLLLRSESAGPLSAPENDDNLEALQDGVNHSSEATALNVGHSVVADVAGAAVADDPEDFTVRGIYHQIKTPAVLGLPAGVTDALVQVTTQKLRLNADDGAAIQTAVTTTAGVYVRVGDNGGWDPWVGLSTPASQAEVNAGVEAIKAVTPATLSGRTATETRTGVAEIATVAETQLGADDARMVTPAKLHSLAKNFIGNGYAKLPGGLILQWGEEAAYHDVGTDYDVTINFPIAFPTGCLQAFAGLRGSGAVGAGQDCTVSVVAKSALQMSIHIDDVAAGAVQAVKATFFAVGY